MVRHKVIKNNFSTANTPHVHYKMRQNKLVLVQNEKYTVGGLYLQGPPTTPAATDENKSTKTWSAWGGKVAHLSKEKDQDPFPQWAFIGFNLHRNTGKAHESLSGSKDQTIDNKQTTLRAYSESGSVS